MFIDFEGIDGSGKTTLSNRVAARLRQLGHRVCHAREGGALASPIAEKIRALTRDPHHLALCETAETLLYAAREAQTLEEVIRPALERGEWVISDRYVYSHLALARFGRGIEDGNLDRVLDFAAAGVMPDLVIFVDVDPGIARARKRCGKIRERRLGDSSRKGQAGVGLSHRVREGFRALADKDPARWVVIDNTWSSLDDAEELLVRLILEHATGKRRVESEPPPRVVPAFPAVKDPAGTRRAYLGLVDTIIQREPSLGAYLLGGLSGSDVDGRRLMLSRSCHELVAYGLEGVPGEGAMALRHALKDMEPAYVARSLRGLSDEGAFALREELADRAPADVAKSLEGLPQPRAFELRERLASKAPAEVLASLAGLESAEAWALRGKLSETGGPDAMATSLTGLDGERAWAMRDALLSGSPLAVVESLRGVAGPRAARLRERFMKRAPRAVLRSTEGFDDEASWKLRESVGPRMREAVDSTYGLDSERAWALRERHAADWPGAAIRSLGPLAVTLRGQAFVQSVLSKCAGDVDALRQATWVQDEARALEAGTLREAV